MKDIIIKISFIIQVLALGIVAEAFFFLTLKGKKKNLLSGKPDPLGECPSKKNKYFNINKYAIYILLLNLIIILIFSSSKLNANPKAKNISEKDYNLFLKQKPKLQKQSFSAPTIVFRFFISIFQNIFSPQDGPACPYSPTCSAYGKQAIHRHGFIKGTMLTADRLIRCNPSSLGGKDPVPE